jgi:hypothetical protein
MSAKKYNIVLLAVALLLVGIIATSPVQSVKADSASTTWSTLLDDEFTTPGIPAHWHLYDGHYGSGPSNNCATPSQDSAPGDGSLHLTMSYKSSGICGAGWYEGGMQIADQYNLPNQALTVRWKIVPSADPSVVKSHFIIPMLWPDDPKYKWYQGEEDYCESSSVTSCTSYLHDGTSSNTNQQVQHNYTIDLTQWHTWRFEQYNGKLTVYIDNMSTPVWTMNQGTTVLPSMLRRAVLQQECTSSCPSTSSAYLGDKQTILIDSFILQVPAAVTVVTPSDTATLAPTTTPTSAPTATATPIPATPTATAVPIATATPSPTDTAVPTATPLPTDIPSPTPTPSGCVG